MPISSVLASPSYHPGYEPGKYYFTQHQWGNAVSLGLSTGSYSHRIYYVPFILFHDVTIDRLRIEVTQANSAPLKLGIFSPSTTIKGYPGRLIASTAFLDCSSTGLKDGVITNTLVTAGVYWHSILNGGGTLPAIRGLNGTLYNNFLGDTINDSLGTSRLSLTQEGSFSDFPDYASSSLTISGLAPLMKFRVKP